MRFQRQGGFRTLHTTNPAIGNVLEHDPRNFKPAFDPAEQRDQRATAELRQQIGHQILDIGAYLDALAASGLPPQLVQASFFGSIKAANTPIKLIPKNPRRQSWRVSNYTSAGVVLYSFDYPMGQTGNLAGLPIPAQAYDQEENGSVSINDIWVFTNDPGAALTYPIPILGYEGALSLVGNKG